MPLEDIKLQDRAIEFLRRSVEERRLAHALLFFGPESVGKRLAAAGLAKMLNCALMGPSDFCGSCSPCRRIDSFNYPDVHWIEPEGPGDRIKIEKIRSMKEKISLMPFEAERKIFIIDRAHRLAGEAANSILKTLEEPPGHSIIVLITDDLNKIFPTIRSRCQWVLFGSARPRELKEFLMEEHNINEREAHFISHLAHGRIGRCIRMKDEDMQGLKNSAIDTFTQDNIILREAPLFFNSNRKKTLQLLDILIGWYRDIFIFKNGGDERLIINQDRLADIRGAAERMPDEKIRGILAEILKTRSDIDKHVNPKLALAGLATMID